MFVLYFKRKAMEEKKKIAEIEKEIEKKSA